jgi:hypothetical protein
MGAKAAVAPGKASDKAVRQELTRILGSKTFSQVDRKRFVGFIVTRRRQARRRPEGTVIGVRVLWKRASTPPTPLSASGAPPRTRLALTTLTKAMATRSW